jgi:glycosyltransferase involved in cell wall biosynthesis
MRVLFVVPYPPSRIRVRTYGFVRRLAQQHEVTVIALGGSAHELSDARHLQDEGISVQVILEPRWRPYLRVLGRGVAGSGQHPLQVTFAAAPGLRAAVVSELRARRYDLVHVEHVRALSAIPSHLPVPVVWDAVDCVSLLFEEAARFSATPLVRAIGQIECRRLRAYERYHIGRFRHVLVTSERDRQALLDLIGSESAADAARADSQVVVLPHGIDRQDLREGEGARQPGTLIFSGKMDFHANVAGARMLAERILPLIWRQRPEVRLTIAGSNPPSVVQRLARDPRITVTGYVPDLRPYIAHAWVAISPLPYAVGIQNKVLEAMALGTPVVASPSAASGLQAVPDRDLLVAGTPDAFAAAVLRVLDEPAVWQRLSERGLAYVASFHNWETIIGRLTTVYARAVAARPAAAPWGAG